MPTPPSTAKGDFVVYDRLRGHKGQVLCVAAPESKAGEALLATGAEDSTVRLWDLRDAASPRVSQCLCRCFDGEAVSSVVFGAGGAHVLYCSAGSKVLEFDLRAVGGGLLVTSPTTTLDDGGAEEVNELAVHPKGDYLAAADDSGVVKVYNTRTRRAYKTLRNAHESICHAVRFRPRASWDVASGALDSTLVLWDFSTGRVRLKLDLANDLGASAASASICSEQQLFNPPFVYSVDFSMDGRFLAAGLGDSGIVILDAKSRTPVGRCDGHAAPISQVHYPCFDSTLLISSGNDQRLLVWDHRLFENTDVSRAGKSTEGGARRNRSPSAHASGVPQNTKSAHSRKKKARGKESRESPAIDAGSAEALKIVTSDTAVGESPGGDCGAIDSRGGEEEDVRDEESCRIVKCSTPLSTVRLENKPNWVTSVTVPYEALVVADTSSEAKILRRWGG